MKKSILLILITILFLPDAKTQVTQEDFIALKAIYNSTNGDDWLNNNNWNINGGANDVTNQWYGITVEGGRVTRIDLQENNLDGYLPSEIENLTALKHLNVYDNDISVIGSSIGALTSLEYLSVGWNPLTVLSTEIFNLTSLTYLNLSHADTDGLSSIPSAIGNLTLLDTLELSSNNLTTLPDEIWSLTLLKKLNLNYNSITNIPAKISNLSNLNSLNLNFNKLESIPDEITNLQHLTTINLEYNQLIEIPADFGNLTKLKFVRIGNNFIETIPDLSGLTDLLVLTLEVNNLDFGDLEHMNVDWFNIITSKYSPQAKVKPKLTYENNLAKIEIQDEGTNNVYQWYKDGQEINGENTNTLIVSSDGASEYYCAITNNDFPDLELQSETIIPANSNVFDVVFTVSDNSGIIQSANVTLANHGTKTTNVAGQATFENVAPEENISYIVSAEGYDEYSSSVSVTDEDVQVNVTLITTSINELINANASIFPNPSSGSFKINLNQVPTEECELHITDLSGKLIHQQKLYNTENVINIDSNAKGIHFIKIINKKGIYSTYKLIIN